ncbi:MAG: SusC/RagA family TonB-linked outer membrane protein [Bacteroidetes bacterium]|nr:SusC/RagA family TonB-linked outer membrane protein [Bacteroidota bacterium]MBS1973284.1 SusC/RagA family TonB-linked outer membrane protein [Bacteroidota bacterium]
MNQRLSAGRLIQWLTLFLSFMLFVCTIVNAQEKASPVLIKGKVTEANGTPLSGANVVEKGAKAGVFTDYDGNFSISVSKANAILLISYVGYSNLEIALDGKVSVNAVLQPATSSTLSGVVVTALGITRNKRSLGYDVGQVSGEDMNHVAQTNPLNAMAGRVSGMAVSSTGASPTATVSVVIRGIRSLNNDNQPLFVVDGVPLKNSLNNIGTNNGSGNLVDYGNTISDINPNDIESISVLKGPSAAALYGSRAGNGVIIITTKSGKKAKGLGISFSSTNEAATPYHYFPTNQSYTVGTDPYTTPNGFNSWNGVLVDLAGTDTYRFGTPLNKGLMAIQWNSPMDANGNYVALPMVGHNNLKNFVQTGFNTVNTISIENSSEKDNYRFSYSNMLDRGVIPTTGLVKHNLSLNLEHKISNGFKLFTSINYARSNSDNVASGDSHGVLADVAYLSPSVNVMQMKNYWITPGLQQRKALPPVGVDQSPDVLDPYDNGDDNPWFVLHEVKNSFLRNHIFGNIKASFTFSPHLTAFVRYSQDLAYENRETKISKSFNTELKGYYGLTNLYNTESNTDALITYHNYFLQNFDISASAGGNIQYVYGSNNQAYSASGAGILAPGLFNLSNIAQANIRYNNYWYQKAIYSLYATASLGYHDFAYLDLTGRNDWSSTLPLNNNSYFYPSASLSLLLNKMFNFGDKVSLVKLRGGWASVGKDTDPYNLYALLGMGSFGGTTIESLSGTLKNPNLKPEQAISTEIGAELAFFKSRLRIEGTVYRSDNKNQILSTSIAGSSGYTSSQFNAGLIRSQGIEISLGGTIISKKDFTWDLNVNYSKNNAYVMSLAAGVPYYMFWQAGASGSWTYAKGQPIPNSFDAKGNQVYSDGKIGQLWDNALATVTDKSSPYYGYPLLDDGGILQKVNNGDFQHKIVAGNFNPKLLMGFQTTLTYKIFTLSANVDMRLGGIFYSNTYRYMGSDAALRRQENVGIPIPDAYKNNIPAYLKSNPDNFIKVTGFQQYRLVGGPTTETGGFPYTNNGITINDGAFYPGVYDDGNGGYVENLGDPNLTKYDNYEDAVTNGPWQFGRMNMFDASYIKLRELSISAQLPAKLASALKLQGLSLGVYTRNLIIWTKAKAGVDPELAFQYQAGAQGNGSQFRQGIEYYNITPWTIPLGVRLNVRF